MNAAPLPQRVADEYEIRHGRAICNPETIVNGSGRGFGTRETLGKVWIPIVLVLLTVLLGVIGFREAYGLSLWDAFFQALALTLLETSSLDRPGGTSLYLEIARVCGLLVLGYAIGLAYLALFEDILKPVRIRAWNGLRGRSGDGHAVVCGLGWKGAEIVRDLRARGLRVAVIEANSDNGLIATARSQGAVVLTGDATQIPQLRASNITAAAKVFLLSGSDEANVRILKQIASLINQRDAERSPIECHAEIREERTREFLHRLLAAEPRMYLNTFDTFEATARELLHTYPIDRFDPNGSVAEARVVVVGFGALARAIVRQAVLIGHYPWPRRLRITVLTEQPGEALASYRADYPCFDPSAFEQESNGRALLEEVLPRIEFAQLPRSDLLLLRDEASLMASVIPAAATSVFICLDDGLRSAAYASAILPSLAATASRSGADVHLAYYYNYPDDEHRSLVERNLRELAPRLHVHAFGNFLEGSSIDRVEGRPIDDMAREIADFYRRQFDGPGWSFLSESDRLSNRHAADHLEVKVRSVGAEIAEAAGTVPFEFTSSEIDLLAETEHRRWCAEKLLGGWRPLERTPENQRLWREKKQELKQQKLHIDLVPFDALSAEDRRKDREQILGIPNFVGALGKTIRRRAPEVTGAPDGGGPGPTRRHAQREEISSRTSS